MNPLSKAHIQNVRNTYAVLSRLDAALDKAESCDLDCQTLRDRLKMAKETLRKVNEIYGAEYPERPT